MRIFRNRRWQVGALAVLVWVILSAGWNWYLITSSFDRMLADQLSSRATEVAGLLAEGLALSPPPSGVYDAMYFRRFVVNTPLQSVLQSEVEQAKRLYPRAAYVMFWSQDGMVVVHSRREMPGESLDPTKWPVLEPKQAFRLTELRSVQLGKITGDVTDVTVPLHIGAITPGFVSIGYPQSFIDEHFWNTQRRSIILAAVFTAVGAALILLAVHLASERLERYRRELQQNARARTSLLTERGMLASVLAHEVRSPLTALRFNLHSLRALLAARSTDADRQVELTDRCEREIHRLDGMLNDFLLRTQVIGDAGAGQDASVNAVVREAVEFLRPALERNHVRPIVHLAPVDPHVHVHPDELRQVLLNLAANAQDAMPKGGTLALSTVAEERSVALLIRDSGAGIPAELHERIFEPFFSTKPNGSGLGLALVRRVISGAGGTIYCESAVGEGTTFRIVLPLADVGSGVTQAGTGYAHQKSDPAGPLPESPEIVIDHTAERNDQ